MNRADWPVAIAILGVGIVTTIPLSKRLGRLRSWLLLPIWLLAADRCSGIRRPILQGQASIINAVRAFCTIELAPLYLVFMASFLIMIECWRDERAARLRPCQCKRCGYDLTGNTSGTCPECGSKTK